MDRQTLFHLEDALKKPCLNRVMEILGILLIQKAHSLGVDREPEICLKGDKEEFERLRKELKDQLYNGEHRVSEPSPLPGFVFDAVVKKVMDLTFDYYFK